jgi:hypothetical protein
LLTLDSLPPPSLTARRKSSPSRNWAVNNNPSPEENSTDEERPDVKRVHSAWNSQPPTASRTSELTSVPPPSYPPPQRRKSHEKKWLNEKLQRMGLRKDTAGSDGGQRRR